MRPQERASARRQLDKRLKILEKPSALVRPPRGWIRAIREALGMTTYQFAERMGVSQPRAVAIEKQEGSGNITVDSLERAAHALESRLVYALIPRQPLEKLVYERAYALALKRLRSTGHSMALEDQSVDEADETQQLERLVRQMLDRPGSALWDEL